MQLFWKMAPKLGATTQRMPYSASAHTACSRELPHPKLRPESRMLAPRYSGRLSTKAGSGSRLPGAA